MSSNQAALFVDVSNLYVCTSKKFGAEKRLCFKKLRESAGQFGNLMRCLAYGTQANDKAIGFQTYLRNTGYDVKYKKPHIGFTGQPYQKVEWGVGITVDIIRLLDKLEVVVLSTSDPDMLPIVQYVRDRGVRCVILSVGIARELKEASDRYIEISEDYLAEDKSEVAAKSE